MERRLAIMGLGLIGGSIGLACRARGLGWHVVGYGNDAAALDVGRQRGAADEVTTDVVAAVRGAGLVALCVPVGAMAGLLERVAPHLDDGAVVTDVGSTKRSIVGAAGRVLRDHAAFVGSHPMAGGERGGIEQARADLLPGALCLVTPTDDTPAMAVARVEAFWASLGMRTTRLTPAAHDRLVADVSHLPHALAAALVRAVDREALPLAGSGFRDTTRVAGGDPALWRDILLDNRDHVRAGLLRLRGEVDRLVERLDADDAAAVQAWLAAATARRRGLDQPSS